MQVDAGKSVLFLLKLLLAVSIVFCLAVLHHGIAPIDNHTFENRLKKSKDTVFVLTFFKSWSHRKDSFLRTSKNGLPGVNSPVKHLFISLDDKRKIFYSTIPYLITQGLAEDVYFINSEQPTVHGFSLITSRNLPGTWIITLAKNGVVQYSQETKKMP